MDAMIPTQNIDLLLMGSNQSDIQILEYMDDIFLAFENNSKAILQETANVLSTFISKVAMISEQNIYIIKTDSIYNDNKQQEQKDDMLPADC